MTASLQPLLAENSLFKAVGDVFHPLFELVAGALAYIYAVVPNYSLAIILLTVAIMAILTPLTIKSTRSMIKMQALQPEMQKLRQKYKGAENREQLNQELMRLYRENGVSPTGGCLPMFLQMPALIVLYDVIRGLANTIKYKTIYPTGTVLRNGAVTKAGQRCLQHVCAVPRYIPSTSAMYRNLLKTPGVMRSFDLNLALRPLTHHAHWVDYIPYMAMVAVAVGLQYFQMAQMTKRNKGSAQMNPQMQTMQKIMPLIFAYIYFLIPAGVVVYMLVSSAIRILTQDLIFRYGLVDMPGQRVIGGAAKRSGSGEEAELPGGGSKALAAGAAAGTPKATGARKATGTKSQGAAKAAGPRANGAAKATGTKSQGAAKAAGPRANGAAKATGARKATGTKSQGAAKAAGPRANGARRPSESDEGDIGGGTREKPHPRAKTKRERKAR